MKNMNKFVLIIFLLMSVNLNLLVLGDLLVAQSEFHIITVASAQDIGLTFLKKSCEYNGLSLKILGMNEPYRNNIFKLYHMKKYLKTLPENDIVLFVDGYDVLLLADEVEILKRFQELNVPFVMSCDKHCWPITKLAKEFPESPTPFRYLNSGCYIGYVKNLKTILDSLPYGAHKRSDQALFSLHYLKNPELYTLDYNCKFCLNLHRVQLHEIEIDNENKKIIYLFNNEKPIAIQGNGPDGRVVLKKLWKLFYPLNSERSDVE